jgi:hypothetical protein
MADEVESTPVKRGPGRPRKVQPEAAAPEPKKPEVQSDPDDELIGQSVDEGVHGIMLPDGREYRCADGVITERAN